MKIDKGLTLVQFVDECKKEWNYGTPLIYKYNDLLKQKLIKEMFVNEIEKPDEDLHGAFSTNEEQIEFEDALEEWQEAEKKVIFKGFQVDYNHDTTKSIYLNNKNWKVYFNKFGECYISKIKGSIMHRKQTLSDIATLTNGELETKNIEI